LSSWEILSQAGLEKNMQKTTIEKIKEAVKKSENFPSPTIEYNFEELPKDSGVKKDEFFGVPARFNDRSPRETAIIIYKLS
jgi:hypothetical protein